jgi:hypothetical protein
MIYDSEEEQEDSKPVHYSRGDLIAAQLHSPVEYARAFRMRLIGYVGLLLVFDVLCTLTIEQATLNTFLSTLLWTMFYTIVVAGVTVTLWNKVIPALWKQFASKHIVLEEKGMYRIDTSFPRIWEKKVTFVPASSQQPKEARDVTRVLENI